MPAFVALVWAAVVITGLIGWVLNVLAIVHTVNDPLTALFILRCVGIPVAPLGAVLGIFA